ncbi:molybdate transport repressor ModE-like protein [Actinoalloteichus hoggarensis]|uniref:Hca operon transcriptional activator n=1 Tax=Actinoalloteichus hoggarensis TaxID=1470176 RepID=A0A221W730_9PSEU|nr:LysR family transcriptional regulator [Actinoalloteichus hoggarensis]ASO21167.1 Hca operon transcriptional activator [Actinoalloteichus hoggarensis]MBB5921096.1 molybdate transport repressor ModE-like protein [Actinoalloteichus hoggarensis]
MTTGFPNPNELALLLAVERGGSFTAAAEELGLTQSAVSHAVRTVERKIGAVLFERGRAGARATAAGERALVHARHILRQHEVLRAEARGAAAGTTSGPLRIAAFRSAAVHLLPAALERLTTGNPRLSPQVSIVPELGRGTMGEVIDGRADIAVATLAEDATPAPGLLVGELLREPYLLVYPAGHPAPRTLPLIDWAENCSAYTRDWWSRQDWLPPATMTAADDGVVLSMVAQGLGMAILPELSLTTIPAGVTVEPLDDHPPTRRLVHLTTRAGAQSVGVRQLVHALRATQSAASRGEKR